MKMLYSRNGKPRFCRVNRCSLIPMMAVTWRKTSFKRMDVVGFYGDGSSASVVVNSTVSETEPLIRKIALKLERKFCNDLPGRCSRWRNDTDNGNRSRSLRTTVPKGRSDKTGRRFLKRQHQQLSTIRGREITHQHVCCRREDSFFFLSCSVK